MHFTFGLEYTPRCPKPGTPFTESEFVRRRSTYTFNLREIGIVLVDLWNFGWEDGPVVHSLGADLSLERGRSHARRKKEIIETRIAPAVQQLRDCGVQIFHCNHPPILMKYPQWIPSTSAQERENVDVGGNPSVIKCSPGRESHPSVEWTYEWQHRHSDDVFNLKWQEDQGAVYDHIRIPDCVAPCGDDLLVFSHNQFHRLLSERNIRVLFYIGFETDECVVHSTYGIRNMNAYGYMTNIVRDCTTTCESAETLPGLWRTKVAVEYIEKRWGYSITVADLLTSIAR